jgi:TPR repeat protein
MYHFGRGQKRDFDEARKWYQPAVKSDHAPALNNLATIYRLGQGVPIDLERAFNMYKKAAGEHTLAKYNLGKMYFKGQGVERSPHDAAIWYYKSALDNFLKSIYKLATLYENGIGVSLDIARAKAWYEVAAKMGHKR